MMPENPVFDRIVILLIISGFLGYFFKGKFDVWYFFRPFTKWGKKQPGRVVRAITSGFRQLLEGFWARMMCPARHPLTRIAFTVPWILLGPVYLVVALLTEIFFPGSKKK